MRTIQDDIEKYTKMVENWLSYNDHTLELTLSKSHISVDKQLTDIEFIKIQLGYVCICLQILDGALDVLIDKHKLAKVDFGTPMCFRTKRLYDHKIIPENIYKAIGDFDQAATYLTTYFYAPIVKNDYSKKLTNKPPFEDFDMIIRLANST